MNRSEERVLIRRAAAGDRAAAEVLVRAQQRSLYSYVVRISGRPDVAEDVVQEAFVRALKNLSRYDETYRFSTWLFTIARRVYLGMVARKSATPMGLGQGMLEGDSVGEAVGFDRRDQRSRLHDALQIGLAELPMVQREIVLLFHQQQWSIDLIGRFMGLPQGTVKSHLNRARNRLRVSIEAQRASSRSGSAFGLFMGGRR